MKTIRFRNPHLHLVNVADVRVLYDTNRVKTYTCSPVEAALIDGVSSGAAMAGKQTCAYSRRSIREAKDRLRRLSDLSASLAHSQGIVASPTGYPTYLFLNLCDACNLKCTYCYAETCAPGHAPQSMSMKTARSSIDWLFRQATPGECYRISFAGGEPLLNFNVLSSAAGYARKRSRQLGVSLQLKILTNGTVMNKEILQFITDNHITLQISQDGPPDSHDRLRPTKNGSKSSQKIDETIAFLKRHHFYDFNIRSTLCHSNTDLPKIAGFIHKQGISEHALRPIMAGKKNPYRLDKADVAKISEYYDRMGTIVMDRLTNGSSSPIPEAFALYVQKLKIGMKTKRYCGAGRNMVVVTPNGQFYPCPVLVGDPRFCRGSLERGFHPLQADAFPTLTVDEKSVCRGCWARNLCGGGCMAQAIRLNDDPELPDPVDCAVNKSKIRASIAIYAHTLQRSVL